MVKQAHLGVTLDLTFPPVLYNELERVVLDRNYQGLGIKTDTAKQQMQLQQRGLEEQAHCRTEIFI